MSRNVGNQLSIYYYYYYYNPAQNHHPMNTQQITINPRAVYFQVLCPVICPSVEKTFSDLEEVLTSYVNLISLSPLLTLSCLDRP